MACARVANEFPAKACAISMVLFIVNCGLKVGNSFLYIFSRFLSFTEILHTFDFLCLRFFYSLTDLFLCDSETQKNNNKEGFYFFRRQGNIYETWQTRIDSLVESCTSAKKKALEERRLIFKISVTLSEDDYRRDYGDELPV